MFNRRLDEPLITKRPKDPSSTTPVTKFIYLNMNIWNQLFSQEFFLGKDSWDLIVQYINVGKKLPPLAEHSSPALNSFCKELGFYTFDDFDSGIFYLSALRNGLLLKIDLPSSNNIKLENIDWLFVLANQPRDDKPINEESKEEKRPLQFTYIQNLTHVAKWQKLWKNFQTQSLPSEVLCKQAHIIREASKAYLDNNSTSFNAFFETDPHIAATRALANSLILVTDILYAEKPATTAAHYFQFLVGCVTLFESVKSIPFGLDSAYRTLKQILKATQTPSEKFDNSTHFKSLNYRS